MFSNGRSAMNKKINKFFSIWNKYKLIRGIKPEMVFEVYKVQYIFASWQTNFNFQTPIDITFWGMCFNICYTVFLWKKKQTNVIKKFYFSTLSYKIYFRSIPYF